MFFLCHANNFGWMKKLLINENNDNEMISVNIDANAPTLTIVIRSESKNTYKIIM